MAGGFFKGGLINGQGYIKTANEYEYTGEMVNHRPQGDGELTTPYGFFSGKFKDGKFITGRVFMKDSGGVLYENGKSTEQASTQSNSTTNTTIQNILNVSIKMLAAVVSGYSDSAKLNSQILDGLLNDSNNSTPINSISPPVKTKNSYEYQDVSASKKSSMSNQCSSDFGCGVGNSCVKKQFSSDGVCMKSVDSSGSRVYNTPDSNSIGVKTSEGCRFNTDCPVGFSCDETYRACVKK